MANYIEISGLDATPRNFPIAQNSLTIGSDSDCDIRIEHSEAEPKALQIDVRGDDFWVQNCNPYSIFVGTEEVRSSSWSSWPLGEPIQLTRSLSLNIRQHDDTAAAKVQMEDGLQDSGSSGKKAGMDTNKLIQIGLIVVCFVAAPLFLLSPGGDKTEESEAAAKFDFAETIEELSLKEKNDVEYRSLRKYLQQAWVADRRWKKSKPNDVAEYYALLLNHRLIDEQSEDETIASIGELAEKRIRELRFED